ncbi:Uncharacterised protein [Vibrio cholerae]|nr:Uncharacterised protein [Vibrio cholerae]CSB61982.1 Uncharacterised protein [Vibrio cholerae]CSB97733.1 Uncharacterised protein [Vibrio cholerae]
MRFRCAQKRPVNSWCLNQYPQPTYAGVVPNFAPALQSEVMPSVVPLNLELAKQLVFDSFYFIFEFGNKFELSDLISRR